MLHNLINVSVFKTIRMVAAVVVEQVILNLDIIKTLRQPEREVAVDSAAVDPAELADFRNTIAP
tara:strand:+ start:285 stop:476 length:192 start_codon:yes stop_codon:yes gene_type:complete